jgi:hypothetical protein
MPRLAALARAVRLARVSDRWRCRVTLSTLAAGATPLTAFARGAEARLGTVSGVLADVARIALRVAIMPSSSVSRSTLSGTYRADVLRGNVTGRS